MVSSRIVAACAALAGHFASPAHATPEIVANPRSADSIMLANALSGQALQLTMRGTTVAVMASAAPAEDGCSALISAHAPGMTRRWNRLFRWSEIAWLGTTPEGGTMVSFFENEGRLPGDRVVFSPSDGAAFRATVARLASSCRDARGEAERFLIAGEASARSCYFARLPGLQLLEASGSPAASQPRAMLTVLSRETPEAELQLLLERTGAKGDDWGRPAVSFTFADPRLKDMRIAQAAFALDRQPLAAQHSLATYSDTRLRISMDSRGSSVSGEGPGSFYRRLAASEEVALKLLDRSGQSRAVLHFDAGPALAAARRALAGGAWSCDGATPAPPPAARWEAVE